MMKLRIEIHPFYFILFFIFAILKLTHVINWSWFWVTSPLWIAGIIVFAFIIFAICYYYIQKWRNKKWLKK